jgi:hypothetical protein
MALDPESKTIAAATMIVEEPLTPAELQEELARQRFIAAAQRLDFDSVVQTNPVGVVAAAFAAGLLIGYSPGLRKALADGADTLIRMWLKGSGLITPEGEITAFTPEGQAKVMERCL